MGAPSMSNCPYLYSVNLFTVCCSAGWHTSLHLEMLWQWMMRTVLILDSIAVNPPSRHLRLNYLNTTDEDFWPPLQLKRRLGPCRSNITIRFGAELFQLPWYRCICGASVDTRCAYRHYHADTQITRVNYKRHNFIWMTWSAWHSLSKTGCPSGMERQSLRRADVKRSDDIRLILSRDEVPCIYLSIVFLRLLTFLLRLLHRTVHPSLVLPLMRLLNSPSLLTLIVIWLLFQHLSWNNAFISYFPLSITSSICLSTGILLDQFKNCSVHPHFKKSYLDKDDLGNYRPISHLSFLSKLTERVVKLRLADYLSTNNLLNSFQSA